MPTTNHVYPGQASPPGARFQSTEQLMQDEEDGSSGPLVASPIASKDDTARLKNALRKFSASFFLLGLLKCACYSAIRWH